MDGKQLRNSILQWAIQGKLVPQDPNDEPASVLLERIREEKARLVKEKKIKRDKNESIIYRGDDNSYYEKIIATGEVKCIDDEIPFDLPNTWCWVRLDNVITLLSGRDLEPSQYNNLVKGIPYMTGASNFLNDELIVNRWTMFPATISHIGELLITCKGTIGTMAFNAIGDIHIARQIMSISSNFINLNYLKLFLEIYVSELEKAARSIIPGISRNDILTSVFPVPPLNEQARIVEFINGITPSISLFGKKQTELIKLNDKIKPTLKKSILQEAIQGRLVVQCETDEPASVLLEKIRAKKKNLVKEGKLKKSALEDSVIFKGDDNKYYEKRGEEIVCIDNEVPFTLPKGWEWTRFGSIVFNRDSERIPLSVEQRKNHNKLFDYYGASGIIDKVEAYLFDKPLLLIGEDGANLINRSTPIAFIARGMYWVNNHAHVADLMGHESIETTRIYLRRTASEQQAIVDRIITW